MMYNVSQGTEVLPMNEFESQVLKALASIQGELTTIKADIEELKESAEVTRSAANYNGEKLDELTQELKRAHLIA